MPLKESVVSWFKGMDLFSEKLRTLCSSGACTAKDEDIQEPVGKVMAFCVQTNSV